MNGMNQLPDPTSHFKIPRAILIRPTITVLSIAERRPISGSTCGRGSGGRVLALVLRRWPRHPRRPHRGNRQPASTPAPPSSNPATVTPHIAPPSAAAAAAAATAASAVASASVYSNLVDHEVRSQNDSQAAPAPPPPPPPQGARCRLTADRATARRALRRVLRLPPPTAGHHRRRRRHHHHHPQTRQHKVRLLRSQLTAVEEARREAQEGLANVGREMGELRARSQICRSSLRTSARPRARRRREGRGGGRTTARQRPRRRCRRGYCRTDHR